MAKSRRLELEDNIYGHYRSNFSHCDVIGHQSHRIRWEKRKIRAITPFKIIQGHSQETRLNDLSCGIKIGTDLPSV